MTRDFSEKAKQKLEGYADDAAASSTWGKIKDWFSDRGMDFQSWTGKLGIENYINDVDTYHQKIIDKNNATKKKIDTIFSNVQSVDTKSMAAMNRQITCGNNIIKLINDLAASISPDGGNLDMAGMKGTLDADAARIKNPESAKNEKTEKEKLGAGDTSCKKSSDPVNLSTGNFIYDHEDMQAGGEIPLSFHRYYNSKDTGTGTMGSCFLHNYEMEVQKQPDQKAAVRMHDGQFYYFAETDTGYVAENAAMGLLEGRKTAISLHVIRAWMPCTLIKTERRQGRKTQTKGESHLSVMKEEGWKRRKPIQEASLSMHMTVKACSWKSQTMRAER